MGKFERFGSWIDRGIERILGKPQPVPVLKRLKPSPVKVRALRLETKKAMEEEVMALWREERMPVWERKMRLAIEKHKEEGMEEEELVERYGEFA